MFKIIASKFPALKFRLVQAGMKETPDEFVRKTLLSSVFMGLGLCLATFPTMMNFLGLEPVDIITSHFYLIFFVLVVVFFFYMINVPTARIYRMEHEINKEIVYAGRFLIIELGSGVPLYDAFAHVAKNYETIGKHFQEIVDKIDLGTEVEQALNEVIEITPSANLRKILWQILNSMKTGADVTTALDSVVDQITKEQQIMVKEYGRKLNPLAMFYMIIAVIIPSLGMTMMMVLSTFIGLKLDLTIFFVIVGFLGFSQFMFLSIIKSVRPPVDL